MHLLTFTLLPLLLVPLALDASEKWLPAIAEITEADKSNPPPRNGVVFIGSSSIAQWTSLEQDFPGVPVINRGIGGSMLVDAVTSVDRVAIPYQPRVVVLYAGGNDLNAGKTPERVFADFKAFVTNIHVVLPQTKIVYIAIKPSPSGWKIKDKVVATNALISAECAKDKRLAFADIYQPMLDAKGQPRPELFVKDMLHLNRAGYAVWKTVVAPLLR